jgi:hypothetical protein
VVICNVYYSLSVNFVLRFEKYVLQPTYSYTMIGKLYTYNKKKEQKRSNKIKKVGIHMNVKEKKTCFCFFSSTNAAKLSQL